MNKKTRDEREQEVRQKVEKEVEKVFDISQMSNWTGDNIVNIRRGKVSQINERLRIKDKEELIEELL